VKSGDATPAISFVVPAWNEEVRLPATLAALRLAGAASGRAFEIVVADDGSTDRTAEIARAAGARVVPVAHRQIAATRNSGARAASGDLLFFVDADTLVPADVVRAALAALDAGAVGGGAAVRFDARAPLWGRALLALVVLSFRLARLAAGCFLFCRRSDFEAVGGFDEALYASEEIPLSRALGRRGRFVVLGEAVVTSGRKFRSHPAGSQLRTFVRLVLSPRQSVRSRRLLGLWYDGSRERDGAPPEGR
jgi:glycosyltransferase involved in cell wall biosynthesis